MRQIITHFTDDDLYKFTMCCAVIDNYPRAQVRYVFHDRNDRIYPPGFAAALEEQVKSLESLRISAEEVAFMQKRCPFIPTWFYSFLKGFRYDASVIKIQQDAVGRLQLKYEGNWTSVIMLEVKILAIISELYHIMSGEEEKFDYAAFRQASWRKAAQLIKAGCKFSDFGTRRRASFKAQELAVEAMRECQQSLKGPGHFTGSSNVWLAMKYDLVPMGTMAHEFIAAIGGMYGPQMANHIAMRAWSATYRGSLGIFLYDTFGWEIFSLNFSEDYANMFKGLRVDSGDNFTELRRIVDKYRSLDIDPKTKAIIFSNNLSTGEAIKIQEAAKDQCLPAFGIGTHFTNDFKDVTAPNIVIKLVAAKITESWPFFNQTCKLSQDPAKNIGDAAVIKRFREALHLPPLPGK